MLRTGKEHLETLRDGRVVYIGSERVEDVTRHPAFRNAAAHRRRDLRHEGGLRRTATP